VRADIAGNDFSPVLHVLALPTVTGVPGTPALSHRYVSLVLAGPRPGSVALDGGPPTREQLRAAAVRQVNKPACGPRETKAGD
jgi:hypothetical protein